MPTFKTVNSHSLPNRSCWCIALLAALIVVLLALLVHIVFEVSALIELDHSFKGEIEKRGDPRLAWLKGQELRTASVSPIAEASFAAFRTMNRPTPALERDAIDQTVKTLEYLFRDNYSAGQESFDKLIRAHAALLKGLVLSQAESGRFLLDLSNELSGISSEQEEIRNHLMKIDAIRGALRDVLERFNLIANDFGEFFGLPAEFATSEVKPFQLYTAGILKGLPVIPRIPDQIEELPEFKEYLDAAGGAVKLEGADIHIQFQERLAEFKSSFSKSSKAQSSLLAALNSRKVALEGHRRALKDQVVRAEFALLTLLSALLEPRPSGWVAALIPASKRVSDVLDPLKKRPGKDMPPAFRHLS